METDVLSGFTLDPLQLIILLIVIIILAFIFIIYIVKQRDYIKNHGEYGTSRFAKEREIHRDFDKENLHNIKDFGFPIWFDKSLNYMLVDRQTPHWLFLGSTGSGKSLTAVKPQAAMIANAKIKRSVFFSDPKGELFNDTSKMFKDNGYKVITLDFRNPTLSNKINLLEPVITEWENYFKKKQESVKLEVREQLMKDDFIKLQEIYFNSKNQEKKHKAKEDIEKLKDQLINLHCENDELINESMSSYGEASRLVISISEMITKDDQAKDPFWNSSAGNLLAGLIFYFLEQYEAGEIKREMINLNSIIKFSNTIASKADLDKFKVIINNLNESCMSKQLLQKVINGAENTYRSIESVFAEKTRIFTDINVANVTSESDFDFDCLGKGYIDNSSENGGQNQPVAMYVIIRDEDESYNILITLIVSLMYKCLVKLAVNSPKGMIPIKTVFLLDEFANCPSFSGIESMVTVARSRGMMFQFFIQEFSQLDKVYGKETANIIKGNAGLVYLKTTSYETAELVSKRLGKKTISSSNINRNMSFMGGLNGNKTISLMGREVFTPDEIMNLEYKTIIFPIKKSYPIFRDTVPFFTLAKTISGFFEGVINREPFILSKFDDRIYTIKDIKSSEDKDRDFRRNIARNVRDERDRRLRMDTMKQTDLNLLEPAMNVAKDILRNNVESEEILENNGRLFGQIVSKRFISNDQAKALQKINKNQTKIAYLIETKKDTGHTVITIYINDIMSASMNWLDLNNTQFAE